MLRSKCYGLMLVCACCISFPASVVQASERQEIRFYKANRQLQTDLIWFTRKKGRLPGCHNFLKKTRVYMTKQLGFKTCTVYTKKECAEGSELTATRKKDETLVSELSEGYIWKLTSEHKRGSRIRSWACE